MSSWGVIPGSGKWSNTASSPCILTVTGFVAATPLKGVVMPTMEFTLSEPIRSGYLQDVCTVNGIKMGGIYPLTYPYIIQSSGPLAPAKDGEVYTWHIALKFPQHLIDAGPITDNGTISVYNHDGKLVGAIDYDLTFATIA